MKIAAKCTGATFSLGEDDKAEFFEEVDSFKYLGHVLHRADADWPAVLQIIGRARQVWGQLGKFMRRERADPIFSAKFYQAVFQAVPIFWAETRVLMAKMLQKLDGVHIVFLKQVAGMKV